MSIHRHDLGTWIACAEGDVYYCESEERALEVEQELLARRRCACGCPLFEGDGERCWYCDQRRSA